jgi:hypothetical protein
MKRRFAVWEEVVDGGASGSLKIGIEVQQLARELDALLWVTSFYEVKLTMPPAKLKTSTTNHASLTHGKRPYILTHLNLPVRT